jgi:hypothetical protein
MSKTRARKSSDSHRSVLLYLAVVMLTALGRIGAQQATQTEDSRAQQLHVRSDARVQAAAQGLTPPVAGPPSQPEPVFPNSPLNPQVNNNTGATGVNQFTQSETSVVAFGNTVVVGFNDSGSFASGSKFTGWSYSTDGGANWTDGGTLPTSTGGDAGDPVLARDETTGRIYLSTLGFSVSTIQVFRSDDNGVTWSAPVNGTPGGSSEDKEWMAVDNFVGAGNGNVYLVSRRFGGTTGIYLFRSTDDGATFGPSGGTSIVSAAAGNVQGAFVAVGPDHAVYVFWYDASTNPETLKVRKSTDQGATFGPAVTVVSGLVGGTNGDMALTGIRQGTATPAGFRSSQFPHVAINPVSGNIYVVYANDGDGGGPDRADVFLVQSINGGATFSAPVKINDDATTTDQWMPTLAVTPNGFTLGIFYYSRQEDSPANNLFKYYGRIANISGSTLTFNPSFAVSDTASLPEFGRDSIVNSVYMGDYNQAVATSTAFHVVWSDNRDDLSGGAPRKDPNVYHRSISLAFAVTTTVPAVGSVVSSAPSSFTVNIIEPANPASLSGSDFQVNGIGANSVSYVAGTTTMTFNYASTPVTAQGVQTMHVNAGAFTAASNGAPVALFDGTFRYDTVLLQVTSTVPSFSPPGVFTLSGPLTYDVNFNEPVDPGSVQATDLALTGIAGSSVSGVSMLAGNTTARFTLSVPTEGALTATIAAGNVADPFGNPNAAFSAVYTVDAGTAPFPPLTAKVPLGSLIYDPSVPGSISSASDVDIYSLAVDTEQTITAFLTPAASLQPTIRLRDGSNTVLATATGAGAGQNALLQTVANVRTGGPYTLEVTGASGTVGSYALQVILNAAKELEGTIAGVDNNTLPAAQNINGSFIGLRAYQAAQRGAVMGVADGGGSYTGAAVPFSFEDISSTGTVIAGLTNVDDASVAVGPAGFSFPFFGTTYTSVFVSSNGLLTFGTANTEFTNTDLTTAPTQAAIAPFWDDLHTAGGAAGSNVFSQLLGSGANQHLTIQWNQIRFFSGGTAGDTITFQAQLYADGRIQFNYSDLVSGAAAGNNGASATVGIKAAGTQGPDRLLLAFNNGPNAFVGTGQSTLISRPSATPDLYSFSMVSGDVTTLAVKATVPAALTLDLLDSGGAVLATGVGGSTNLDSIVANFNATSTGTYYARVNGNGVVNYDLVVTLNATFDNEANDAQASGQALGGSRGALGHVSTTADWYLVVLPAGGNALRVETGTPGDGPGEFVNTLNPHIELYDASSVLIASGASLPDGRNETILGSGLTPGTYAVRVTSEGGTSGEYFVSAGPPLLPRILAPSADPSALWPPNGQLVDVTVNYGVSGGSGVVTNSLSVASSETAAAGDWEIVDDHHVRLRAARSGSSAGRNYTITIRAVDETGAVSTETVVVTVPARR